ncbi:cystathionine beta-lyase [Ammoniphilus sp. 3BR4]|uniref:cystathionine beta-lyase n=1 Tax=Ammoniphilus sp. 3BR4 TaxID=3158265 RepID=UPI003467820D
MSLDFGTRLIHNRHKIDAQTGASSTPMYLASTYHQFDVDAPGAYDYSRSGNPTRHALEETIAELEAGTAGFAFSSGMAAISTVFLLFSSGDHLIVSEDVYGGTYRVLSEVLSRMGITCSFVDTTDLDKVKAALTPQTKGVYIETPSNPLLKVTDVKGVAEWAQENGLISIVDNTFLTPFYQRPLELGADIVIHSATKFISGHSDVVAGLVAVKDSSLAKRISFLQNAFGAILGVQDCWLVLRGLKTLKVRMETSTKGAEKIARWLETHPNVKKVYYTGLPSHPGHEIQSAQSEGHGAVLTFDVGDGAAARNLMSHIKLPIVAVSLGSVESILSYPCKMSHASMPEEERNRRGITDGLMRLSVGLENPDDLIADLEQALTLRDVPVESI